MNLYKKTNKGFTLLEVLVVVAIIGFLSAVVFTAANASRIKGRNAKTISQVREYQKAFAQYYQTYGYYPVVPVAATPICLGTGYNYAAGKCIFSGTQYSEVPATMTELSKYIPSTPPVNTYLITLAGGQSEGAIYTCVTTACPIDPATSLNWVLEGQVSCGPGTLVGYQNGNTLCTSDPAGGR